MGVTLLIWHPFERILCVTGGSEYSTRARNVDVWAHMRGGRQ